MDVVQDLLMEIRNLQCLAWVSRHARAPGAGAVPVREVIEALRIEPAQWEEIARALAGSGHLEVLPGAPDAWCEAVRLTPHGQEYLTRWEESLDLPEPMPSHGHVRG